MKNKLYYHFYHYCITSILLLWLDRCLDFLILKINMIIVMVFENNGIHMKLGRTATFLGNIEISLNSTVNGLKPSKTSIDLLIQ